MADFYIDPDVTAGGAGTELDPYKSWAEVTFASNNNYYQKRGTSTVAASGTFKYLLAALTNINIGTYDTGNEPIVSVYQTSTSTGDWADQGGNVWMFDDGYNLAARSIILVGLGSLGNATTPSWTKRIDHVGQGGGRAVLSFSEFGQWDANEDGGGGTTTNKLYVYSDENPVTKWGSIYYTRTVSGPFQIQNGSTNINISGFKFMHSGRGIANLGNTGTNDNVVVEDCISEHCYLGFSFGNTGTIANCGVKNNVISAAGSVGIRINGAMTVGNYITDNIINNTGGCDCVGGIYGNPVATGELLISGNQILTVTEDPYWANEGYGLYSEQQSENITWSDNYVYGCADRAAFHINGGSDNVVYSGNLVVNCKEMFNGSDSSAHETDNYSIHDNVAYNLRNGIVFNRPSSNGTMTAFLKNNIIYSDGTGGTDVLIDADTAGIAGSVDEDYNCFFGFTTENNAGANNITTDPEFVDAAGGDFNIKSTSGCVGTGVKHWGTGPRPSGYQGDPKPDTHIDIGFQSTWNENHPKNL